MQSSKKCKARKEKSKECDLLRRGYPKNYEITKADKTILRNIFKNITVTDFLLYDCDFSESLKTLHYKLLQCLESRLDILHNLFTFVNCAMRNEKNFSYKEHCLNDVFKDHFSDMTLLSFFCDYNEFDTRFIQMDLLCNFRRFHHDSIKMIMKRITNLENTIHCLLFDNYFKNRT